MPCRWSVQRLLSASFWIACLGGASACSGHTASALDGGSAEGGARGECAADDEPRCEAGVAERCEPDLAGQLRVRARDCSAEGLLCVDGVGCAACEPGTRSCLGPDVVVCAEDGIRYTVLETCGRAKNGCARGECVDQCQEAADHPSHLGCNFVFTDLDNAASAGALPFGVTLANPNPVTVEVELSVSGQTLATVHVAPRDVKLLELPQRQVDGSSAPVVNDGTHSALTESGYAIEADMPIAVVMFNPLGRATGSSDASLVLPATALGRNYTVVGFPQSIADDEDPNLDASPLREDEDLRAFVSVVALEDGTSVALELGPQAALASGGDDLSGEPGSELRVELAAFEVLNLETGGYGASFSGSRVHASRPVAVFSGAEATDIPLAANVSSRQCCAEHLETQLLPDAWLGQRYVIAHSPHRAAAVNAALVGDYPPLVESEELDWIRVVAPAAVMVRTTLDPPDDRFELAAGEEAVFSAPRDFVLEASGPVALLQGLASQTTTFIPGSLPGGDPALISPASVDQHVAEYLFATPSGLPFEFVVASAPKDAELVLDGEEASASCSVDPVEGDAEWQVYRCPLSRPEIDVDAKSISDPSEHRLVHTLTASQPIAAWVYAFGAFASYAYEAGKQLRPR